MLSEVAASPNLDSGLLANITLALNYLRQAQQTVTPPTDPPEEEAVLFRGPAAAEDLEEGELERRAAAAREWRNNKRERSATSSSDEPTDSSHSDEHVSTRPTSMASSLHNEPNGTILPPEEDATHFCTNCRQLLAQLDQQIEQRAYLKRDLNALASALSEEEAIRANIEQVKESLEEDIQDIMSSMFKTLNCILMDEVADRDGLVRLDRETGGKLAGVLQAWDTREERLKEFKEQLIELDAAVNQSAKATDGIAAAARQHQYMVDQERMSGVLPPRLMIPRHRYSSPASPLIPLSEDESIHGGLSSNRIIRIDGLVFDEFQQHIKALQSSPNVTMPSTPFMKRVIAEDIDPCLFQNAGSSWWKSPWFKRKLTDAIASNRVDIQAYNSSSSMSCLSSSSTSSSPAASHISSSTAPGTPTTNQQQAAPKTKCTCCGHLRICEFRMRLHSPAQQQQQQAKPVPWLPIDRFCRDRIVAVCDFYAFMTHLRQGLMQNSSVLQMFKQCLHFRRRMGLAKVGSTALFDDDGGQPRSSSYQSKRRSRSSLKRESLILDQSGSSSDSGSVVSLSDMQGSGQVIIVH